MKTFEVECYSSFYSIVTLCSTGTPVVTNHSTVLCGSSLCVILLYLYLTFTAVCLATAIKEYCIVTLQLIVLANKTGIY